MSLRQATYHNSALLPRHTSPLIEDIPLDAREVSHFEIPMSNGISVYDGSIQEDMSSGFALV